MWVVGGFCGYGGSVWVMGEWAVGHWIVGVTSFQKIYGLYGLKHLTVDLLSCRFLAPTNLLTDRGIPRGPRGPKKYFAIPSSLRGQWTIIGTFGKRKLK